MRTQSEHVKQLVELYKLNQDKMVEETKINYKGLADSGFDANSGKQEGWGFGNKTFPA